MCLNYEKEKKVKQTIQTCDKLLINPNEMYDTKPTA